VADCGTRAGAGDAGGWLSRCEFACGERTTGASGGFITVVLPDFEVHPIFHTRHAVNEPICNLG
jgi:hypothetical protein